VNDRDRKPTVKLPAAKADVHAKQSVELIRGETRVQGTRHASLDGRVERVETVLGVPRPAPRPPPATEAVVIPRERLKSSAEDELDKTAGGMIAHNKRLETAVGGLTTNDANQNLTLEAHGRMLEAQSVAMVIFARELGVEDKLPPLLCRSVPPPKASSAPPPPPVLGRLELRAKHSQVVQFVIAVYVLVETVREIVAAIHPSIHP
jgi:hypothetical protein